MPPRKSNVSITSNGAEEGADATPARQPKDGVSVEDLSLPKSMIARLAKGVLPANTQIQKDALLALHKSATVFVSYIASNSNEIAQSGGKKTISPQDVMAAMKDCELEDFLPRLEAELKKYNEVQCDKRNTYRRKVKEDKAAATAPELGDDNQDGETAGGANGTMNGHINGEDADRPAKKFKADDGTAIAPNANGLEDEMDGDHDDQDDEDEDEADVDDEEEDDVVEVGPGGVVEIDADEHDDDLRVDHDMRDEALDEPGDDSSDYGDTMH